MGVNNTEPEIAITAKYSWTLYPKPGTSAMNEPYRICKYVVVDGDKKEEIVATGNGLCEIKDVIVTMYGSWVQNKGRTSFQVTSWVMAPPDTKAGITEYLCSLKCGIGKRRADLIYTTFKENVWDIIENQPERLGEAGLSKSVVKSLRTALQRNQLHGKIMHQFRDTRISYTQVDRLVNQFGGETLNIIENHPYQICKVEGFSFRLVDAIALQRGIDPTNIERREAAAIEVLDVASAEGHVCLPRTMLVQRMVRLLNANLPAGTVTEAMCDAAITEAAADRLVAISIGFVYTIERFCEEKRIAKELFRLIDGGKEPIAVGKIDATIKKYETENGLTLADSQKEAVRVAINNPVCVLTGGPGTGKTTTTKAILYAFDELRGDLEPELLSPTGKAARRMNESTGYPASTIHSALCLGAKGYNSMVAEDAVQTLEGNIVIVDETSMADQYVTCELVRAVKTGAHLVFVGDPNQLPSVGCGNVLYELIRSTVIPTVALSVIFRQAEGNPIVENSLRVKNGNPNLDYSSKSFSIKREQDPETTFTKACDMYMKSVAKYGTDSTVLLCPYRSASTLNVNRFNIYLQSQLNPPKPGKMTMRGKTLTTGPNTTSTIEFREGDRVMQTKNTPAAKNGDVGYIKRLYMARNPESDQMEPLAEVLWNDDTEPTTMTAEEMKNLDLAYCSTVHKSQGSEYPNVIMVMSTAHQRMLRRNLFYTGITRAKENVLIVGDQTAVTAAILDDRTEERYTLLGDRLYNEAKKKANSKTA